MTAILGPGAPPKPACEARHTQPCADSTRAACAIKMRRLGFSHPHLVRCGALQRPPVWGRRPAPNAGGPGREPVGSPLRREIPAAGAPKAPSGAEGTCVRMWAAATGRRAFLVSSDTLMLSTTAAVRRARHDFLAALNFDPQDCDQPVARWTGCHLLAVY
mgnify:CR=1 FL=1